MARVPYLTQSDLPAEYHDLIKSNSNLHRALVNSPEGERSWHEFGKFMRFKSKLDPRLREMAILQVGYLTRSVYEYTHHIASSRKCGVSDDEIRAIAEETDGRPTSLDPLTKAVLRATRELTADLTLCDATFAELRKGLDNERLIDLVITIGRYNAVVRMLAALQIDTEENYLRYLDEFPLPKG